MHILLTGATGFLGRHLAHALRLNGHEVLCAVRNAETARARLPDFDCCVVDFTAATDPDAWRDCLANIDVVINVVGIFQETKTQSFKTLHVLAPCALFAACARAGVQRIIQISALGADQPGAVEFLASKQRADAYLLQLPLSGVVLQPAPVFGVGGASASLFLRLANFPLLALPEPDARLQPVHVDDICAAVLQLAGNTLRGRIAAVGPVSLSVRDYLAVLRRSLGLSPAHVLPLPLAWLALGYRLSGNAWLNPETTQLLRQSRAAESEPLRRLIRRPLIEPRNFLAASAIDGKSWRHGLWSTFWCGVLRYAVAAVWIVTGWVSLWVYPKADSLFLLERSGFGGQWGPPLLYLAGALDLALGLGTILLTAAKRRWLWLLQAGVIAGYTLIISWRLPEFWAHPYGPILKNLPLLAAIGLLYSHDTFRNRRP